MSVPGGVATLMAPENVPDESAGGINSFFFSRLAACFDRMYCTDHLAA